MTVVLLPMRSAIATHDLIVGEVRFLKHEACLEYAWGGRPPYRPDGDPDPLDRFLGLLWEGGHLIGIQLRSIQYLKARLLKRLPGASSVPLAQFIEQARREYESVTPSDDRYRRRWYRLLIGEVTGVHVPEDVFKAIPVAMLDSE